VSVNNDGRRVIGIDGQGRLQVENEAGDGIDLMVLRVLGGHLRVEPLPAPDTRSDQLKPREHVPVALRHAGVDQLQR
jgi:hypothetical protein